jgi:NAD(P)-dependent dehydrogenase (short-subunit alcohol dehydrogenase family)
VKDLTGKVALVTGGTHGVGRAIALAFAESGADVAINYSGADASPAQFVAMLSAEKKVRSQAYPAEIADETAVIAMIKAIETDFGHIDILVNNASISRDKSVLTLSRAMWNEVLGVNLNGPFNITNAVLRHMVDRGWGRIVNICALGGQTDNFGQANYMVTKGGLIAFTMTLARELARKGITVNAVAPGYTATAVATGMRDEVRDQIRQKIPMGRLGEPEEIAAVVTFLAGPRASYITGQVIGVNGGMNM